MRPGESREINAVLLVSKKIFNVRLHSVYEQIWYELGMVTDITKFYSLVPV